MKVWALSLSSLDLSAQVLTPSYLFLPGIRSLVKIPGFRQDILSSALPPGKYEGLALKLFRGEPAIPELV